METILGLEGLADAVLRDRLRGLASVERRSLAGLLRHLAEADRRDASRTWGYPSLFFYCTEELRYSEAAAYKRITATRKAVECPAILGLIERGELHLEGILVLAPHLNAGNQLDLLERARGASKRALEALVAELVPRPDKRDCVMRLATGSKPAAASSPAGPPCWTPCAIALAPSAAPSTGEPRSAAAVADLGAQPLRLDTLSPGRMHMGVTISTALWAKLERVRGLLRHKHPRGRLENVLEELAEVYLDSKDPERRARRRTSKRTCAEDAPGLSKNARQNAAGSHDSRSAIARAVRDAVFLRDGGQCAFKSADGLRCASREWLELDHILPRARGGLDNANNLRVLCRGHNQHAARKEFGRENVGPHRRVDAAPRTPHQRGR